MSNKLIKEWFVEMPWGKVAMISWGESSKPPILMVHGYLDTAATFSRLLELLPDTHYYVSFDFPGHGKSDHVLPPGGPLVTMTFMTEVVRRVVDHMGWETFTYMGHSMAFFAGIFYHHAFPGRIKRMINLDPEPPTGNQYYLNYDYIESWFMYHHQSYYDNYHKMDDKLYTYEEAIAAMMNARSLTREQTELLLARCLVPANNGLYRMTFQSCMRRITGSGLPEYTLSCAIATDPPPVLNINATTNTHNNPITVEFSRNLMKKFSEPSKVHRTVYVEGKHDVHITNPDRLVPYIIEFLNRDTTAKSKL
ncbi:serine hydrolase-like protein 2 [Galleria mellonella]|uniref:Serine hydrolase-like protein 2 n=1 Tax=Galleria mellonella TaxID=7137 RepID=A0A6J1WFN3_GALME|nr:serine hydrolase-like protein 2 [Galleria mellonella]